MSITAHHPHGQKSLAFYHVSHTVEVYDEDVAEIVDHLMHHIGLLESVAGDGVTTIQLGNRMARYPHYGVEVDGYAPGITPRDVINVVIYECIRLLNLLAKIESTKDAQEREVLLAESRTIPFLATGDKE